MADGERFGVVHYEALVALSGNTTAIALYAMLATYARNDQAYPSRQRLADDLGVSVNTVQRATVAIVDVGLLAKQPRLDDDGRKIGTVYLFRKPISGATEVSPVVVQRARDRSPVIEQSLEQKDCAAVPARRAEDPVWDALMLVCGIDGTITKSARGAYNRAAKDLREIGATPAEIHERADGFRARWPDVSLTPTALVRRWAECGRRAAAQQHVTGDPVMDQVRRMRQAEGR